MVLYLPNTIIGIALVGQGLGEVAYIDCQDSLITKVGLSLLFL